LGEDVAEYPPWVGANRFASGGDTMQEDPNQRSPNSGPSATGSSGRLFNAREALRGFFRGERNCGFASRRKSRLMRSGARLNYMCERALDAYTLMEALKWEKCIVEELTGIIEVISASDLRMTRKGNALFDLMHERARHNRSICNIETAMRRNETITWMR
jgi:hypothetical protein